MILINIDNGNVINASKFSERYIEKLLSTKKFIKESDKFEVSTDQGVEILEQERIRLVEWEEKLMNKENELNELAKSLELINENKQKKNGKK
ncbi:MAG TPA: hypothetical protein PKK18_10950 [Chitinophagales bacterium]|nr:hypothetical protein [Chitinophagales bacterium]HNJ61404.1 hypothetical protein [Chitinophagales bacterium]HNK90612.1 hypothetical protein [Chitinophagales bacterium]HNN26947.1 hypothetical protein [Chitinophagales bacterium]HNO48985.1 hypothetical protein [Chitinophagales bacterium]